jgi:hypothetical protein
VYGDAPPLTVTDAVPLLDPLHDGLTPVAVAKSGVALSVPLMNEATISLPVGLLDT